MIVLIHVIKEKREMLIAFCLNLFSFLERQISREKDVLKRGIFKIHLLVCLPDPDE